jgi:hypothetical protein
LNQSTNHSPITRSFGFVLALCPSPVPLALFRLCAHHQVPFALCPSPRSFGFVPALCPSPRSFGFVPALNLEVIKLNARSKNSAEAAIHCHFDGIQRELVNVGKLMLIIQFLLL